MVERRNIYINGDLFKVLPDKVQRTVLAIFISGKVEEIIKFRERDIQWALPDEGTLRKTLRWLHASDLIHSTGDDYWLNPTLAHEIRGNPWGKWTEVKHIPF